MRYFPCVKSLPSCKTASISSCESEKAERLSRSAFRCSRLFICSSSVGSRKLSCTPTPEARFPPLNGEYCSLVPSISSGLSLSVPRSLHCPVPSLPSILSLALSLARLSPTDVVISVPLSTSSNNDTASRSSDMSSEVCRICLSACCVSELSSSGTCNLLSECRLSVLTLSSFLSIFSFSLSSSCLSLLYTVLFSFAKNFACSRNFLFSAITVLDISLIPCSAILLTALPKTFMTSGVLKSAMA